MHEGKLYQPSAALTASWLCSLPLHNCSGPGLGALHLAWEERADLPPGPGQMVQSLRQMLSTGGSQSVFGPAAMHSSAAPGRRLARHGAHLTTIPHLTPAAQPTVALSWGPQPCRGPPLGDAELCCVGKMSFTQSASQSSSLLCTPDRNVPRIYLTQEVNAVKQCDLGFLAKWIFVLEMKNLFIPPHYIDTGPELPHVLFIKFKSKHKYVAIIIHFLHQASQIVLGGKIAETLYFVRQGYLEWGVENCCVTDSGPLKTGSTCSSSVHL